MPAARRCRRGRAGRGCRGRAPRSRRSRASARRGSAARRSATSRRATGSPSTRAARPPPCARDRRGDLADEVRPVVGLVGEQGVPGALQTRHGLDRTPAGRAGPAAADATRGPHVVPSSTQMADVTHDTVSVAQDPAAARRLLRAMMLIRRFEERTEEQYTRARIGGYCHLAIGEEAATVGADRRADRVRLPVRELPRPRHGARRGQPARRGDGRAVRQVDGRRRRLRRLDAPARRRARTSSAAGASSAATCRSPSARRSRSTTRASDGVVLCQFGDGATNTGAFHESLNLAAIWHLPIVFQIVNNQYGMGTSVAMASAETELYKPRLRLRDARRAGRRQRRRRRPRGERAAVRERPRRAPAGAARDDDLPLPRPLGRRRRQGLPHARGDRRLARGATRSRASSRDATEAGGLAERRRREAVRREVDGEVSRRDPRGGVGRRARPDEPLRQRLRRPRRRRAVRADGRRRRRSASGRRPARGGRDLPRGAAPRARRGARARRARLPDRRGDRPLRGLLQGHRRALQEVRRQARARDADLGGGLRRRRHRRGDARPAAGRRDHDRSTSSWSRWTWS